MTKAYSYSASALPSRRWATALAARSRWRAAMRRAQSGSGRDPPRSGPCRLSGAKTGRRTRRWVASSAVWRAARFRRGATCSSKISTACARKSARKSVPGSGIDHRIRDHGRDPQRPRGLHGAAARRRSDVDLQSDVRDVPVARRERRKRAAASAKRGRRSTTAPRPMARRSPSLSGMAPRRGRLRRDTARYVVIPSAWPSSARSSI